MKASNSLMATGEVVNKPTSLPPYPEMILKAIEALDEENGSNKSSISKYIESTYGGLPPGHKALLNLHLAKMRDSGQLVFWKNNYTKYDPNAPPRRGRGRPPKNPNEPPKPPKAKLPLGSGRPRGRPRKMAKPAGGFDGATPSFVGATTTGRPRGRPPKTKPQFTEINA